MNPILTPEQIRFFRANLSMASKYLLEVEPVWYQGHMLNSTINARFIMWICSRGVGKTFTAADLLILCAALYNELNCCVYAKDFQYTKATFDKIDQIYEDSKFLRAITTGPPRIGKDRAILRFKNRSKIMAEPFKRGRRWHQILLDEAREMEIPDLSTVILPMLSDPHAILPNKLLMASSATYAGQPLHKLYEEFVDRIKKGDTDYAVCDFNVYDALSGPYMDSVIVAKAKEIMLEEEFQIEFENQWVNLAGGWMKGPLIRSAERDYRPELKGDPGFCYTIGLDFGRATGGDATSATVTKIVPDEGCRIIRNVAVTGMPIPEQALLVKQLWKDYGGKGRGEVVGIKLDYEKLGYAVCDSLKLPSIDPRDGEELPPLVQIDDVETPNAIPILKPVNFADRAGIYIMATIMKKGFETGTLTLPKDAYKISMSEAEKTSLTYTDREIIEAAEEISDLKREMCSVEVQSSGSGTLSFKRSTNRKDKKDRFTSAFLSASEALDYYDQISDKDSEGFVGCWGSSNALKLPNMGW